MSTLEEDLSYLRSVAADDRPPILRAGATMLAAGVVFGLSAIRSWAYARGFIVAPWAGIPPLDAVFLFLACLTLIPRFIRAPGASTASTRALTAMMTALGTSVAVLAAALGLTGRTLGEPNMILAFPAAMFILFAAGWWVAFATVRRIWIVAFVGGSFGFAMICASLAGKPEAWLAMGAGLLLTVALPGWIMIRSECGS